MKDSLRVCAQYSTDPDKGDWFSELRWKVGAFKRAKESLLEQFFTMPKGKWRQSFSEALDELERAGIKRRAVLDMLAAYSATPKPRKAATKGKK